MMTLADFLTVCVTIGSAKKNGFILQHVQNMLFLVTTNLCSDATHVDGLGGCDFFCSCRELGKFGFHLEILCGLGTRYPSHVDYQYIT